MKKTIILMVTAFFAFVSLNAQDLTILHLNDTHSHIDPIRGGRDDGHGGVIECAAYVDSVRSAVGKKNLLMVHAGDFGQGTSYFPMMNGEIEIEVMNELGFDASALGNHEFDNGYDDLARRLKKAKFDVVCANYDFSQLGDLGKYVKPYTIVKKAGKKIGIVGLLVDVTTVVDHDIAAKMQYFDPIETAQKYAAMLKSEKKCDYVIVLSHVGTVGPPMNNDKDIAANTHDVDLVVGGHSHTFLSEPMFVENLDGRVVPVVTDGCWGIYVGSIGLTF
ncbi:MAG: metallophosphoesterase [Bacteroidales bacterium]|nr:metallophosphoesterase [Bacteroidales bacterium]